VQLKAVIAGHRYIARLAYRHFRILPGARALPQVRACFRESLGVHVDLVSIAFSKWGPKSRPKSRASWARFASDSFGQVATLARTSARCSGVSRDSSAPVEVSSSVIL
jgi:hypothetical protein